MARRRRCSHASGCRAHPRVCSRAARCFRARDRAFLRSYVRGVLPVACYRSLSAAVLELLERLVARFTGPRGPLRLAVLACALSLPALGLGFQADDHIYRLAVA